MQIIVKLTKSCIQAVAGEAQGDADPPVGPLRRGSCREAPVCRVSSEEAPLHRGSSVPGAPV